MNPISHLFVGWTLAEETHLEFRDRAVIAWAGVAPDFDGLSAIPDVLNRILDRPPTEYFFQYHHMLGHGLPAALLMAGIAYAAGRKRMRTALWSFAAFHLHLLCDLVGSAGPDGSIWPIPYLQPISDRLTFSWSGQWALNAWPNIAITIALMILIFVRAVRRGYSPLSLFSSRADRIFVETLRRRFGRSVAPPQPPAQA